MTSKHEVMTKARRLNVNDIIEVEQGFKTVEVIVKSVFVNFDGAEFAKIELADLNTGLPLVWTGGPEDELNKIGRVLKENCRSSSSHHSSLLI
jgi:hypothetical protein